MLLRCGCRRTLHDACCVIWPNVFCGAGSAANQWCSMQASNTTHSAVLHINMGDDRLSWHAPPRVNLTVLVSYQCALCSSYSGNSVIRLCGQVTARQTLPAVLLQLAPLLHLL